MPDPNCDSRIILKGPNGECFVVNEGDSSKLAGQFLDLNQQPLQLSAIQSVTITRQEDTSGRVINNRQDQNVLDANGGSLTDSGDGTALFTLKLGKLDNVPMTNRRANESHTSTIRWTWQDAGATTRDGSVEWVNYLKPNVPAAASSGTGWTQ